MISERIGNKTLIEVSDKNPSQLKTFIPLPLSTGINNSDLTVKWVRNVRTKDIPQMWVKRICVSPADSETKPSPHTHTHTIHAFHSSVPTRPRCRLHLHSRSGESWSHLEGDREWRTDSWHVPDKESKSNLRET